MRYKLIASISFRLLMARWRQTLVAAVGVTSSITMFVGLLSFMSGLNDMLDGIFLNRTPHIRLYKEVRASKLQPVERSDTFNRHHNFVSSIKPKNDRLELYDAPGIMADLKLDERVIGVAPKLTAQVFYNVGALDINGMINGIDVEAENALFMFKDNVVQGNYIDLKNVPNSIILWYRRGSKNACGAWRCDSDNHFERAAGAVEGSWLLPIGNSRPRHFAKLLFDQYHPENIGRFIKLCYRHSDKTQKYFDGPVYGG